MAPLAPDLVKLLKKGGHFVDPNLETLAKVGAALSKGAEADLGQDEDDAIPRSASSASVSEASEDDSEPVSDEEETDDSDGDSEAEDSEELLEEENTEDESDDETSDGDAQNALDELVDVFRSENGRDPTELEMLRWIKTLRDSGGDGPVSFEAMESEEEEEEEEEDEDEDEDSSSSEEEEKAAPPVAREKKRRGADASRARDAAAPPAKKPKAAESSAGKASAAAAAFVAAKAFGGAKPGYYFRKGAKGLGYYLDANANARKTNETAKKEKKSSVFSVPREQAEFQPAKRFSGAKPGFVFKKGARGLGYYLDRPPKVTWKGGGGGGARRGDWARNVGGGRRSGGKNKGGRGGRRF
jgi:hypothetical protein